jgi:hypothetical protein
MFGVFRRFSSGPATRRPAEVQQLQLAPPASALRAAVRFMLLFHASGLARWIRQRHRAEVAMAADGEGSNRRCPGGDGDALGSGRRSPHKTSRASRIQVCIPFYEQVL